MGTPSNAVGYVKVPVFHFLWGYAYNDFALSLISGLKPTEIRISTMRSQEAIDNEQDLAPGVIIISRYAEGEQRNIFSIHYVMEVKLPQGIDSAAELSLILQEQGIYIPAVDVETIELEEQPIPAKLLQNDEIPEAEWDRRVKESGKVQGSPDMTLPKQSQINFPFYFEGP